MKTQDPKIKAKVRLLSGITEVIVVARMCLQLTKTTTSRISQCMVEACRLQKCVFATACIKSKHMHTPSSCKHCHVKSFYHAVCYSMDKCRPPRLGLQILLVDSAAVRITMDPGFNHQAQEWTAPSQLQGLCVVFTLTVKHSPVAMCDQYVQIPPSTIKHTISEQMPRFHPCRQHIQCCMLHSSVRSALWSSQHASVPECTAPTLPRPQPFPRARQTPVDIDNNRSNYVCYIITWIGPSHEPSQQ